MALTITGTGFVSYGAVSVKIDGNACSSVVVVNDTTITCNSPAHSTSTAVTGYVTYLAGLGGNTNTSLYTFTIPDEAVTVVDVTVAAVQSTGAAVASYKRSITFKRDGGTVTIINTVRDNATDESTAAWDCTLDNSTSTGRVGYWRK